LLAALALEFSPLLRPAGRHPAEPRIVLQGLGAPAPRAAPPDQQDWQPARDSRLPPVPVGAPKVGLAGAAVRGDLVALERALAAGAAIDELDSQHLTPLLWAMRGRRVDAARTLIERGARVDLAMPDGTTPLMLAAQLGLESVSALLIERGARLDTVDRDGRTALMLAARGGHHGVLSSLLTRGAVVGLADGSGRSALMYAALAGASAATIDALIDHGAGIEARTVQGATPLILAASWGHADSVRALLARGARMDARDQHGLSALDWVVKPHPGVKPETIDGLEATLDVLIASGIDPRLTVDPALTQLLFRPKLEALYQRHGLGPLPPYRMAAPAPAAARAPSDSAQLDSPATVKLLSRADGAGQEDAKITGGALVGYRGWTSVPKLIARAAVREVALYGDQRATLVGDARGEGEWSVADVLLLELMENGRLVDIAFAGSAQGLEVNGKPVRRLGAAGRTHAAGAIDLTDWLMPSGRVLVVSALSSFRGGSVSDVYLRINGAGARRSLQGTEVDHSGGGGTL
jgi:ankyrin repeat protein